MRRLPTTLALSAVASLLVALSVTVPAQAEPDMHVSIIGGVPATEDYPWLGHGTAGCGFSVISSEWLVTAAHCLSGDDPWGKIAEVRLGSRDEKEGGEVIQAVKEFKHPDHPARKDGKRKLFDIALVKLSRPYSGQTVGLPTMRAAVGTPTRLLGWGALDPDLKEFPRMLQQLDTKVREDFACDTASGIFMPGYEICTDNPRGTDGACSGDSGGPQATLVDGRWTIIGVTSRGGARCGTSPSVYTDVLGYKQWILDTVRKEDGKLPPELDAWSKATPRPTTSATPTGSPIPTVKPTTTPTPSPTANPNPTPTAQPTKNPGQPRPTWWPTNWPWPPLGK